MGKIDALHFNNSLKGKVRIIMEEGKYIYCIMQNRKYIEFGPIGIGGRGDTIYTISYNDISAVVSNSPNKKYSTSRKILSLTKKLLEKG